MIRPADTVLFQGDSITACGRDVQSGAANTFEGLGRGYVLHVASMLLCDHAAPGLRVLNRGVSGHRLADLAPRWQRDTLDLEPDVLSILIGINDVVAHIGASDDGHVITFETEYRQLLSETKSALPDLRLVICEPFALRCGEVEDAWLPIHNARRATARRMAEEFDAVFVPFQSAFDDVVGDGDPCYWSTDGVHPTLPGYLLMARVWLAAVQGRDAARTFALPPVRLPHRLPERPRDARRPAATR